ncbi:MAG: hypothetical protein K0Q79_3307 [Flavipsychrobacter sp.]|nr:hypothetical protein [Flavipsychrobacter sp.]
MAALVLMSFLYSCRHKANEPVPAASMTVLQPVANQVFKHGDVIKISGTINGLETMHGYRVYIIGNDGDSLCCIKNHTHANTITIDESWVDSSSATTANIIISSAINHEGDEVKKVVPIKFE